MKLYVHIQGKNEKFLTACSSEKLVCELLEKLETEYMEIFSHNHPVQFRSIQNATGHHIPGKLKVKQVFQDGEKIMAVTSLLQPTLKDNCNVGEVLKKHVAWQHFCAETLFRSSGDKLLAEGGIPLLCEFTACSNKRVSQLASRKLKEIVAEVLPIPHSIVDIILMPNSIEWLCLVHTTKFHSSEVLLNTIVILCSLVSSASDKHILILLQYGVDALLAKVTSDDSSGTKAKQLATRGLTRLVERQVKLGMLSTGNPDDASSTDGTDQERLQSALSVLRHSTHTLVQLDRIKKISKFAKSDSLHRLFIQSAEKMSRHGHASNTGSLLGVVLHILRQNVHDVRFVEPTTSLASALLESSNIHVSKVALDHVQFKMILEIFQISIDFDPSQSRRLIQTITSSIINQIEAHPHFHQSAVEQTIVCMMDSIMKAPKSSHVRNVLGITLLYLAKRYKSVNIFKRILRKLVLLAAASLEIEISGHAPNVELEQADEYLFREMDNEAQLLEEKEEIDQLASMSQSEVSTNQIVHDPHRKPLCPVVQVLGYASLNAMNRESLVKYGTVQLFIRFLSIGSKQSAFHVSAMRSCARGLAHMSSCPNHTELILKLMHESMPKLDSFTDSVVHMYVSMAMTACQ